MTFYISINIKKLLLFEDDKIQTQIYNVQLNSLNDINFNEANMLIFWNVYKTNGDYYPLYLNDSRG
jgi:hypothetical protein